MLAEHLIMLEMRVQSMLCLALRTALRGEACCRCLHATHMGHCIKAHMLLTFQGGSLVDGSRQSSTTSMVWSSSAEHTSWCRKA